MLDRKTKNFEASVELLKDRRKHIDYFNIFLMVEGILFAILFFASSIRLSSQTEYQYLIILSLVVALFCFTIAFVQCNEQRIYDVLICLKQDENKEVVYIKRKEVKK